MGDTGRRCSIPILCFDEQEVESPCTVVQRTARLAERNPTIRGALPVDGNVPQAGDVRAGQPTQAVGGHRSQQYSRGQGRLTTGEFRHFLGIARGSNFEIQTQLEIARMLDIGDQKLLAAAEDLSQKVGRLIYFLLESLKENPPRPTARRST
jgi:hypothetical protein